MGKVLLVMYILTGILLFILAAVLYKMELSEAAVNISIIISYIVVGFVGGFIIGKIKKSRKYLWGSRDGTIIFCSAAHCVPDIEKGTGFRNAAHPYNTDFMHCFGNCGRNAQLKKSAFLMKDYVLY